MMGLIRPLYCPCLRDFSIPRFREVGEEVAHSQEVGPVEVRLAVACFFCIPETCLRFVLLVVGYQVGA